MVSVPLRALLIVVATLLSLGLCAPSVPPSPADFGQCSGRVTLKAPYGLISDHLGAGNYSFGAVCEFHIAPDTPTTSIYLHFFDPLFVGRIQVFSSDVGLMDTLETYTNDEGVRDTFGQWEPTPFASSEDFDYYMKTPLKAFTRLYNSSRLLIRFIGEDDPFSEAGLLPPAAESWPGFVIGYSVGGIYSNASWTADPTGTPVTLPPLVGAGLFSDALWLPFQTYIANTYVMETTLTGDKDLGIKHFQPGRTTNELRIFKNSQLVLEVNATTVPIRGSQISRLAATTSASPHRFFYHNLVLHGAAGDVFRFEYDTTGNKSIDSGFVISYWDPPRHCQGTVQLNNSCGWITPFEGIGSISPNSHCEWMIPSVTTSDRALPMLIYIKDFDVGSATGDSLLITTSDMKFSQTITRSQSEMPPLIVIEPASEYSFVDYKVSFHSRLGGGKGFSLFFGPVDATLLPECLNVSFHHLGAEDALNKSDSNFDASAPANSYHFYVLDGIDLGISAYFTRDYKPDYFYTMPEGRLTVTSTGLAKSLVYTSISPFTGSSYILLEYRYFGIPLFGTPEDYTVRSQQISMTTFVPSAAQFQTTMPTVSIASHPQVDWSIASLTYLEGHSLSLLDESGVFSSDPQPLLRELEADASSLLSVAMNSRQLVAVGLTLETSVPGVMENCIFWMTKDPDSGQMLHDDFLCLKYGPLFGILIGHSDDAEFVLASHSPQLFAVLKFNDVWEYYDFYDWIYLSPEFFASAVSMASADLRILGCAHQRISYLFYEFMADKFVRTGEKSLGGTECSPRRPLSLSTSFDRTFSAYGSSQMRSVFIEDATHIGCVRHAGDEKFGSGVNFSPDGGELFITGQRLYVIDMQDVQSIWQLRTTNLTNYASICVDYSKLPPSFYPNRFAYAGQDWTLAADGQTIQVVANAGSAVVLLDSTPDSRVLASESIRPLFRAPAGEQFVTTGVGVTDLCPRGSYAGQAHYSPCYFCPDGYFQNETGQVECYKCPNDTFCPVGSVRWLQGSSLSFNVTRPVFTTCDESSLDSLIWEQLLPHKTFGGPLWGSYVVLLFVAFVALHHRWRAFQSCTFCHKKVRRGFKKADPDPREFYDPFNDKFREKPSAKAGAFCVALVLLLLVSYAYCVYYFASYAQYDGTDESILNNLRSSSLVSFFAATPTQAHLLSYAQAHTFNVSLILTGYSYATCPDLCNRDGLPSLVKSSGCFDRATFSSCDEEAEVSCHSLDAERCEISWVLPPRVELQTQSQFTFFLKDALMQQVLVKLTADGEPHLDDVPEAELEAGESASNDSYYLSPTATFDLVQLQEANLSQVLFGVSRVYELTYVLLQSQKPGFVYSGLDWKVQPIFEPVQQNVVNGISTTQKYYSNVDENQVTIVLNKPSYWIYNIEKRVQSGGEIFLTVILISTAILDVFEVFQAVLELLIGASSAIIKKCYISRKRRLQRRESKTTGTPLEEIRAIKTEVKKFDIAVEKSPPVTELVDRVEKLEALTTEAQRGNGGSKKNKKKAKKHDKEDPPNFQQYQYQYPPQQAMPPPVGPGFEYDGPHSPVSYPPPPEGYS